MERMLGHMTLTRNVLSPKSYHVKVVLRNARDPNTLEARYGTVLLEKAAVHDTPTEDEPVIPEVFDDVYDPNNLYEFRRLVSVTSLSVFDDAVIRIIFDLQVATYVCCS